MGDAFQYTILTQRQISTSRHSESKDSFAAVFFPESLVTLNILGNLLGGWEITGIRKFQINALQWIVSRKFNLKLILFDFCTEFDEKMFWLLSQLPSIETVHCKNCYISSTQLLALMRSLPNIRKLSFHSRISPDFAQNIKLCSKLHTLFLTFGYGSTMDSIGTIINCCNNLEVLHIRKMHTSVVPSDKNLIICAKSDTIQHFNCEIDGGVKELNSLGIADNFPNLKTLVLTIPNREITDEYLYCIANKLPQLEWFAIRFARINKQAIAALISKCHLLKRLDLYCCRMDGNPFSLLKREWIPQLEHLEFVWNSYEYPGYVYDANRIPYNVEEVCDLITLLPNLKALKCTDPGINNVSFRQRVSLCLSRQASPARVSYIRY